MLSRTLFYLIAAPLSVLLCLVVPIVYIGIMLLCPLGFIYRYLIRPAAPAHLPRAHEEQHAGA